MLQVFSHFIKNILSILCDVSVSTDKRSLSVDVLGNAIFKKPNKLKLHNKTREYLLLSYIALSNRKLKLYIVSNNIVFPAVALHYWYSI